MNYIPLSDVLYATHCLTHARYIGICTDPRAIYDIMMSFQVTVANPYAMTLSEQLHLKLVGTLVHVCMRRIAELMI